MNNKISWLCSPFIYAIPVFLVFGNISAEVEFDALIAKGGHHHGHHHHHHHHHHHRHHWHHHHKDHAWFHHNKHPGWNHHHLSHWNNYHNPNHDWYWYGNAENGHGWNGNPGYYYDPNYYYQANGKPTIEYEYDENPKNIPTNVNIKEEEKILPNNPRYNDEENFRDLNEGKNIEERIQSRGISNLNLIEEESDEDIEEEEDKIPTTRSSEHKSLKKTNETVKPLKNNQ